MKKQNILLMMMAFVFVLPSIVTAQQDDTTIVKEKNDRGEKVNEYRVAIEAIKNDATLTEEEKDVLIKEKKAELREIVSRRGSKRGRAGKYPTKDAREKWKSSREAITKELEEIKNDPNLTEEEKETKKRALLSERLGENKGKRKKGGGAYGQMEEGKRQAKREERKAQYDAIKNDTNLTDEQKELKKKELFEENKEMRGKGGAMKGGKRKALREEKKAEFEAIKNDPNLTDAEKEAKKKELIEEAKKKGIKKGEKQRGMRNGAHKEMTKKEWKEKYGKKADGFVEEGLSAEQKGKALAALTKSEKNLAKQLKRGKITQERYNSRIAKISSVREKILRD